MQPGAAERSLLLFASGSSGALQQFKAVEFVGGERGDMPSQGAFSFEVDRQAIARLEDRMISAFGHLAIERAAERAALGEKLIDLGGKMLTDEHLPTLGAAIRAGHFKQATTLSFNACAWITTLPDLCGMGCLKRLSLINASALKALPDLSGLPALEVLKLENCNRLEALPLLPVGLDHGSSHFPSHLCAKREGDCGP